MKLNLYSASNLLHPRAGSERFTHTDRHDIWITTVIPDITTHNTLMGSLYVTRESSARVVKHSGKGGSSRQFLRKPEYKLFFIFFFNLFLFLFFLSQVQHTNWRKAKIQQRRTQIKQKPRTKIHAYILLNHLHHTHTYTQNKQKTPPKNKKQQHKNNLQGGGFIKGLHCDTSADWLINGGGWQLCPLLRPTPWSNLKIWPPTAWVLDGGTATCKTDVYMEKT